MTRTVASGYNLPRMGTPSAANGPVAETRPLTSGPSLQAQFDGVAVHYPFRRPDGTNYDWVLVLHTLTRRDHLAGRKAIDDKEGRTYE